MVSNPTTARAQVKGHPDSVHAGTLTIDNDSSGGLRDRTTSRSSTRSLPTLVDGTSCAPPSTCWAWADAPILHLLLQQQIPNTLTEKLSRLTTAVAEQPRR